MKLCGRTRVALFLILLIGLISIKIISYQLESMYFVKPLDLLPESKAEADIPVGGSSFSDSFLPSSSETIHEAGDSFPTLVFDSSTFRCGKDGVITVLSGGRLGNLMGEYATLLALAERDQLFPILQERTYKTLAKYFVHITVPSVDVLNCKMNWASLNLGSYNSLTKKARTRTSKSGIFIKGYPTSVSLFHRHRHNILKEFQFKPDVAKSASDKLHDMTSNRTADPILIGVHVRRTDYSEFLRDRFNAQLVGPLYFDRAMNYFRNKFPKRALFVVVSDDMQWCRHNLQSDDIVYAGNSETSNPAIDLALLASCNHSIITYGNFGFWGAYLAGGEVILAGNISNTPTELMHSIASANMTGWQFLPAF